MFDRKKHVIDNFYPRPPRGGRPLPEARVLCGLHDFYPRPPRGGRRIKSNSKMLMM